MIIAFEGPDGAGKTTLFNLARNQFLGIYVPKRVFPAHLEPFLEELDQFTLPLWRALRDTKMRVFTDRCMWVSSPVYSNMYDRPMHDLCTEEFIRDLFVVYVRVPAEELVARNAQTEREVLTLESANRLLSLYDEHIQQFRHIVVDGRQANIARLAKELP